MKTLMHEGAKRISVLEGIKAETKKVVEAVKNNPPESILDKYITRENVALFRELLQLDPAKEYRREPIFLQIGDGRAATLGNLSLGIGKQKSGKTQMVTMIVAAVLSAIYGRAFHDLFTVNLPSEKNVILWFDTEQDEYDVQLIFRRLRKLTGSLSLPNLRVYALRDRTPEERRLFIAHVIENTPGCCMVVIDGVKDLGYDPLLDPKEATDIVTELMKLSKRCRVHILSILHQNKGDNQARGHIGTEYMNKCEFAFSVEKDKSGSRIVKSEAARGKEFEPFAFNIKEDEEGDALAEIVEGSVTSTEEVGSSKAISPYNYLPEVHHKVLAQAFSSQTHYKYEQLITAIGVGFEAFSIRLGRNKRIDFMKYYQNNGWIKTIDKHFQNRHSGYIYSPV